MPIHREKDLRNKVYPDRIFALFHLSALGLLTFRYCVRCGVLNLRFWSALGSNFNCCTALGIKEGTGHFTAAQLMLLSFPSLIIKHINTFHVDPYASQLDLAYLDTSGTYLSKISTNKSEGEAMYGMLQQKFLLKC